MQPLVQHRIDWLDSVDHWTIDATRFIVRYVLLYVHVSSPRTRSLYNNFLQGPIPSTIGQLTALSYMYVIALSIELVRLLIFLASRQGSSQQLVGWVDSRDNWTNDCPQHIV
jgi:hypothetical protein